MRPGERGDGVEFFRDFKNSSTHIFRILCLPVQCLRKQIEDLNIVFNQKNPGKDYTKIPQIIWHSYFLQKIYGKEKLKNCYYNSSWQISIIPPSKVKCVQNEGKKINCDLIYLRMSCLSFPLYSQCSIGHRYGLQFIHLNIFFFLLFIP